MDEKFQNNILLTQTERLTMIKAVEENKVSTVIVKDMSRFGRDYLKVGFYTEILFKERLTIKSQVLK